MEQSSKVACLTTRLDSQLLLLQPNDEREYIHISSRKANYFYEYIHKRKKRDESI